MVKHKVKIKHKLIFPRIVYRYDGENALQVVDRSEELAKYEVGQMLCVFMSAPGDGRIVYLITKINKRGVWGTAEYNNIRIMSPSEVR